MASVILLKPKRLSITKVRYSPNGSSITDMITVRIATNTTPRKMPSGKYEAARLSIACKPPPKVSASSTSASKMIAPVFKRVLALL